MKVIQNAIEGTIATFQAIFYICKGKVPCNNIIQFHDMQAIIVNPKLLTKIRAQEKVAEKEISRVKKMLEAEKGEPYPSLQIKAT